MWLYVACAVENQKEKTVTFGKVLVKFCRRKLGQPPTALTRSLVPPVTPDIADPSSPADHPPTNCEILIFGLFWYTEVYRSILAAPLERSTLKLQPSLTSLGSGFRAAKTRAASTGATPTSSRSRPAVLVASDHSLWVSSTAQITASFTIPGARTIGGDKKCQKVSKDDKKCRAQAGYPAPAQRVPPLSCGPVVRGPVVAVPSPPPCPSLPDFGLWAWDFELRSFRADQPPTTHAPGKWHQVAPQWIHPKIKGGAPSLHLSLLPDHPQTHDNIKVPNPACSVSVSKPASDATFLIEKIGPLSAGFGLSKWPPFRRARISFPDSPLCRVAGFQTGLQICRRWNSRVRPACAEAFEHAAGRHSRGGGFGAAKTRKVPVTTAPGFVTLNGQWRSWHRYEHDKLRIRGESKA